MTAVLDPVGTSSVERAQRAISAGRAVIVLDGADVGRLVLAAEAANTSEVAFLVRHTSGFLCVALTGGDCDRLRLPAMASEGSGSSDVRVTVDAVGAGTGISARDRGRTVRALADPVSIPADFTRPGHVVPLRAADGGVLARHGPAEAAVDLIRLADRRPAALLSAIVSTRDGGLTLAWRHELSEFAAHYGLHIVSVADLVAFRLMTETSTW